jgi:hypothetical protein
MALQDCVAPHARGAFDVVVDKDRGLLVAVAPSRYEKEKAGGRYGKD